MLFNSANDEMKWNWWVGVLWALNMDMGCYDAFDVMIVLYQSF